MTQSDFMLNANIASLLSKIRTLKMCLTPEQVEIYNANLDKETENLINGMKEHIQPERFDDFKALVKAMMDNK